MITAQLPDGTQLQFPDDTSQDVIQGVVHKQLGIKPLASVPEGTGLGRTLLEQGLQGATGNFADELTDRGGALIASLMTDEKYKDLLAEAKANSKQRLPAQFAAHPLASIGANVGGGLLTGGALASGARMAAPNLAGAIGSYAATNPYRTAAGIGALSGSVYGAGSGEGGIKERFPDAFSGGLGGAVAGPVGAYIGRNAIAPIINKFSPNKISNSNVLGNFSNSAESLPVTSGFSPNIMKSDENYFSKTGGQRTQNPELQRLENDARAGTLTKDSENAIRQADIQQNREFHSYMDDLAKGLDKGADPNVLVEGVGDAIKTNASNAKTGINNAYDLAREGKGVKIGSSDLRQGLWKGIADIRRENVYDLSQMPKATSVIKRLASYSKQSDNSRINAVKLGELENWRKQTSNALNSSQDPTERKFLGEMVRGYDSFMEKTAENAVDLGDASAIRAFRDAVKQRREYGKLFETNKLVGDVVSGQKSIDDTVKSLMGTGSIKGKKEMANNLSALVKAAGSEGDSVQNDLRQAFTLNAFKKAAIGYEPNNPSMERLSPAKLKTELENIFVHQSEFADQLYGKDVRMSALKAIKELNLISTTQANVKNPSGSGEWLGRFLKTPGVNRIPGTGLIGKALEVQKQHTGGAQVTKGLSDFITENQKYQTPFWAIVPPIPAAGLVNRQEN